MRTRRLGWLIVALALVMPGVARAHPMGNFSISHYAAIQVAADAIRLRYLVDLAEIPTFQALQAAALPPEPENPAVRAYVAETAAALADGLVVELDGRRLALRVERSDVVFPPGAGGLPTLKIGAVYRAALPPVERDGAGVLTYRDTNYPERAGWKEIVATAAPDVMLLASTVPARDRSRELADYPTDPTASPPQELEARVVVARSVAPALVARAGSPSDGSPGPRDLGTGTGASRRIARPGTAAPSGPPVARAMPRENTGEPARAADRPALAPPATPRVIEAPGRATTPRNAFTELIADRPLGVGMILFALMVAASLGAFHALEPGHGKTVVAAYLVGARGTAWHAVLLGLVVTASHTAGVYLLGAVTLYASRYVVPERLSPWLGAASGLLIVALGANLLYRRLAGGRSTDPALAHGHALGADHEHVHADSPAHSHGPHTHPHP